MDHRISDRFFDLSPVLSDKCLDSKQSDIQDLYTDKEAVSTIIFLFSMDADIVMLDSFCADVLSGWYRK